MYVSDVARGDLGRSFSSKRLISQDLARYIPATLELVIAASLLAVVVGIPIGVLSAAKKGELFDQTSRIIAIAGVSIPAFWLGLLLQMLFFGYLDWLPLGGRVSRDIALFNPIEPVTRFYLIDALIMGNWKAWIDAIQHLILPAMVLATYSVGLTIRMTRASMVEVLNETYVEAARAAGITNRVILFRLALKNAIIPTLTVLGLTFAFSITGAVLVEIIFSWPGIGKYLTDAVVDVDFPVVIGVTLFVTIIYIAVNLLIDLLQASLDPRIRLG
jgi:peptide/nickel transport system permease protein